MKPQFPTSSHHLRLPPPHAQLMEPAESLASSGSQTGKHIAQSICEAFLQAPHLYLLHKLATQYFYSYHWTPFELRREQRTQSCSSREEELSWSRKKQAGGTVMRRRKSCLLIYKG
uniref:Uncharacterized protein n=1 Tax=Oryza brachyantha TaxID=4533 RepID=J3M9J7_ORYBR